MEKYSVTYLGNGNDGGSAPVDPGTYARGATATIKGNSGNLTKRGFRFNSWNTKADSTGVGYPSASVASISGPLTLYAHWVVPPTVTEEWVNDGNGYLKYLTNDTANLEHHAIHCSNSTDNPVSTVEVLVSKKSGDRGYAFGVVFGFTDMANYYEAVISANGSFCIQKRVAGLNQTITSWVASTALVAGLGATNTLKMTYNTTSSRYLFYVNGIYVTQFIPDTTLGTAGKSGFFVAVGNSSQEKFPEDPVDVRFRMVNPVSLP